MIYTLHTKEDFIYAYVVFRTVDKFGKPKNFGEYIYIEEIWIHRDFRNRKILKKLIEHIDNHNQTIYATHVYWRSDKYKRISKTYLKDRFIKRESVCLH